VVLKKASLIAGIALIVFALVIAVYPCACAQDTGSPTTSTTVVPPTTGTGTGTTTSTDTSGCQSCLSCGPTSIQLSAGWNFISFSKLPSNSAAIEIVLADVSPSVGIVWGYDNSAKQWLKWKPSTTNPTLTSIELGKGYWIYMNETGTINLLGWATSLSEMVKSFQTTSNSF
jgi:hypothetical protein